MANNFLLLSFSTKISIMLFLVPTFLSLSLSLSTWREFRWPVYKYYRKKRPISFTLARDRLLLFNVLSEPSSSGGSRMVLGLIARNVDRVESISQYLVISSCAPKHTERLLNAREGEKKNEREPEPEIRREEREKGRSSPQNSPNGRLTLSERLSRGISSWSGMGGSGFSRLATSRGSRRRKRRRRHRNGIIDR